MSTSAPQTIILHPSRKIAGVLAPLFALRSPNDLGIGDTLALKQHIDWAADLGFKIIQLLPINETGADNSPYMAVSSTALDPAGLSVTPASLKDLPKADFEKIMRGVNRPALNNGSVNYRIVKPLKLELLSKAFERFAAGPLKKKDAHGKQFLEFVKKHAAWLEDYTLFRCLMEINKGSEKWDDWPKTHQSPAAARRWLAKQFVTKKRSIERRIEFFKYVQWIAFSQWHDVKAHAAKKGVALMGDVPFGVSYYSADVWARPELFNLEWSGGAPPEPAFAADPFTTKWGQNWGIPLYRWDVHRAEGFQWWRQRVHTVREMFDLFRIDHVLGFYRIFAFPWWPQRNDEFLPLTREQAAARCGGNLPRFIEHPDDTPAHCEANRRQGEEILRVLVQEVGKHRLVAEDLGTVPDYVRPSLASLDIPGFKIPQWEREPNGELTQATAYPALSVATYATHDHEPLRAIWERWGAAFAANERGEAGAGQAAWDSGEEMRKLMRFARLPENQPQFTDAVHEGLLHALFRGNSWLVLPMITDLFGSARRFNLPGAIADSNWSERLSQSPKEWSKDESRSAKCARIKKMLRETGRS